MSSSFNTGGIGGRRGGGGPNGGRNGQQGNISSSATNTTNVTSTYQRQRRRRRSSAATIATSSSSSSTHPHLPRSVIESHLRANAAAVASTATAVTTSSGTFLVTNQSSPHNRSSPSGGGSNGLPLNKSIVPCLLTSPHRLHRHRMALPSTTTKFEQQRQGEEETNEEAAQLRYELETRIYRIFEHFEQCSPPLFPTSERFVSPLSSSLSNQHQPPPPPSQLLQSDFVHLNDLVYYMTFCARTALALNDTNEKHEKDFNMMADDIRHHATAKAYDCYTVLDQCTREYFHWFAKKLISINDTTTEMNNNKLDNNDTTIGGVALHCAQMLASFYERFFTQTLPYIESCYQPMEQYTLKRTKRMLIRERVVNCFAQQLLFSNVVAHNSDNSNNKQCINPIGTYIGAVLVAYFKAQRQWFEQYFPDLKSLLTTKAEEMISNLDLDPSTISTKIFCHFNSSSSSMVQKSHQKLIQQLLQMLISLDRATLSVFYRVAVRPLLGKTIEHIRKLALNLLPLATSVRSSDDDVDEYADHEQQHNNRLSIPSYLQYINLYFELDDYLFRVMHEFPPRLATLLNDTVCYWFCTAQLPIIINDTSSGLYHLYNQHRYQTLGQQYGLLWSLYQRTKQVEIVHTMERYFEQLFTTTKRRLCSRFSHFRTRDNIYAFVREVLRLNIVWDQILHRWFVVPSNKCHHNTMIESSGGTSGNDTPSLWSNSLMASSVLSPTGKLRQMVFDFFHGLLQHNEAIPQALAFYLHHVLMLQKYDQHVHHSNEDQQKTANIIDHHKTGLTFATLSPTLEQHLINDLAANSAQLHCFTLVYQFLDLIRYLKDANLFYEYTKHYFCTRLLLGGGTLSTAQELEYFAIHLAGELRRVFIASSSTIGSGGGGGNNVVARNRSRNTTTNNNNRNGNRSSHTTTSSNNTAPQHKHLTQSLNDFHWIVTDWKVGGGVGTPGSGGGGSMQINHNQSSKDNWRQRTTSSYCSTSSSNQLIETYTPLITHHRILHGGIWKFIEHDRCRLPLMVEKQLALASMAYEVQNAHQKRLILNSKYSCAQIELCLPSVSSSSSSTVIETTSSIKLTVSAHQLAILCQFESPEQQLSYEQLATSAGFYSECNLRLSLLSLVECSLLKWNVLMIPSNGNDAIFADNEGGEENYEDDDGHMSSTPLLCFKLNNTFNQNNKLSSSPHEVTNISKLEHVINFWYTKTSNANGGGGNDNHHCCTPEAAKLAQLFASKEVSPNNTTINNNEDNNNDSLIDGITNDHLDDLHLLSSTSAVENVTQNCADILRRCVTPPPPSTLMQIRSRRRDGGGTGGVVGGGQDLHFKSDDPQRQPQMFDEETVLMINTNRSSIPASSSTNFFNASSSSSSSTMLPHHNNNGNRSFRGGGNRRIQRSSSTRASGISSLSSTCSSSKLSSTKKVVVHAIDRASKIEAAIARILKRERGTITIESTTTCSTNSIKDATTVVPSTASPLSTNELYHRLRQTLYQGKGAFPFTDHLTVGDVQQALAKLVDKKYVRQLETDTFEYVLD